MKLKCLKRKAGSKSEVKKIRREGNIPACVYHKASATDTICINGTEFAAHLRNVKPGCLSTTKFELHDESGQTFQALIKDIQYHPTTYQVLHLDFEKCEPNVQINVKVLIECEGIADCTGIKLGGVLRQVIRYLRVRCLPKDIPTTFPIDIKAMSMGDVKRLKDLSIPQTIRPLDDMNEVAVVIAKR